MMIFGFIFSLLAILVIVIYLIRLRYGEIMSDMETEGSAIITSPGANFMGMRSRRYGQVRGNGVLSLFQDRIVFIMLFPKTRIVIPRTSITAVSVRKSFLGKTKFRDLLVITYTDVHGQQEECAWLVQNLDEWLTLLDQGPQVKA